MVAFRLHGSVLFALGATTILAIPTSKIEEVQLHDRSPHLFPRSYKIDCKRKQEDLDLVKAELTNAAKMATYASENLGNDGQPKTYREAFVSKDLLDIPNNAIVNQLKDSYGRGAKVNDDNSNDYPVTITCDNSNTAFCQKGYYAHMNDGKKTLNLCDAWFDITNTKATVQLQKTTDILAGCTGDSPKYKNLEDFWAGKAQALLHEWTHTTYFTGTKDKTIDYAYGVKNCLNLAYGSRRMPAGRDKKKDGKPICPDPNDDTKPGICDKNFSIDNADSLAIMAGGIWFSDKAQCDNAIPIGMTPDEPTPNPGGDHTPVDDPENPDGPADDPTQTSSSSSAGTAAVASTTAPPPPPPSTTAPPPPPSTTAPPPPPPSSTPAVVPCKSGGMFSDGCGDSCGSTGKCVSGSAGFPIPQTYYTCEC